MNGTPKKDVFIPSTALFYEVLVLIKRKVRNAGTVRWHGA